MKETAPRILVADDQTDVLEALRLLLKGEGFRLKTVTTPREVLRALETQDFDVVLIDLNYARDTTSGQEGLDLLARIQQLDSAIPVVVMTAWGSVELAVEAMQKGARDFIQKPWDNARLLSVLRVQAELAEALHFGRLLRAENELLRGEGGPQLVADSAAMKPVLQLISRVGPSEANVLITGENGTGKSVVVKALHAVSPRADGPLVTVNIGGLSEGLFESELFGHVRGAFTDAKTERVGRFEMAEGGTLFLDEVANVSLPQQTRLLRVLETGEFERVGSSRTRKADARVLSATNSDLKEEIEEGRFRQDLLFRLNTVEIKIPPLRQRREDIPLLAAQFLKETCQRYRKEISGFDDAARQVLLNCPWPGNVRELQHAIERGILMAQDDVIRAPDLGLQIDHEGVEHLEDMTLDDVEKHLIRNALTRFQGNVSQAAKALGLSRSALYRRLERHGL